MARTTALQLAAKIESMCITMRELMGDAKYERGIALAEAALHEEMSRLGESRPLEVILSLRKSGVDPDALDWMAMALAEKDLR
jgi:hypothetical protein